MEPICTNADDRSVTVADTDRLAKRIFYLLGTVVEKAEEYTSSEDAARIDHLANAYQTLKFGSRQGS